ncbi:hypothetical protein [Halopiger aswanensis]|uniref:Uncharacterized protein n=1 Tax=Halopiger aswanensis TaxID=148449 RepID=A0A3R7D858_9EURY|nr:hypothetical protein [Halopiger aswanensis]RKD93279.1 hypothetical protein ATJ93_2897 [Halopiger aswanensis]
MTPVALLVVFCAVMSAVALGRVLRAEPRDPVDVGTAQVVVGITLGTVLWVGSAESWLTSIVGIVVGVLGLAAVCLGVATIVRYWDDDTGRERARCDQDRPSR